LARILLEFEDAWQHGQQPVIDDFLPGAPTERVAVLAELAAVDLERRLKAGETIRAEAYLSRYPELAADHDAVQRLRTTEEAQRQRQVKLEKSSEHCPRYGEAFLSTTQDGRYHPEPSSAPASNGNAGPAALPTIAGYEILAELGRGGMGIVYQARQLRLNRLVALKMLRAGSMAGPEELARFRHEAEAVARLHHPHIVQIYEVGGPDHQPYFALEYMDGGNLAKKIQGTPQPLHEAAALVETLAQAVHCAHLHGIIHRDLKPLNILLQKSEIRNPKSETDPSSGVSDFGFRISDFTPKVTDFGLAKSLDAKQAHTRTGDLMGTPAYMAPEQAAGKAKEIGPATDVYALGAILYELLTGRPPFRGETTLETLDQVRSQEPVRPRRLRPKLPRDLDTICLKCLAKEPRKRYATALSLADDLKRFLNGEPIWARPVSWWEKSVKWARRRPAVAALSAGIVASILLAFSIVVWQWRDTRRAWEEAAAHAAAEGDAKEKADAARQLAENHEREAIKARQIAEQGQREALEQRENARDALEFLAGLFHGSDPTGLEGLGFRSGQNANAKISVLELLNNGTRTVNAQRIKNPAVRATLLDQLGDLYRSLGFLDKAERLLKEALDLRQTHCGPEHEDTATSLYHVAWLYHDRGKYADAERFYRQAWAIRQKRFDNDSLPCAQVMFNLAWTLAHQFVDPSATRYEEAEHLLRQVLKIRQDQLGSNHREVGVTWAALATLRFPKNETEGAALGGMIECCG
jgi:serine/threonine protein kinase/tetratricopeptide (TPR) repeat protein